VLAVGVEPDDIRSRGGLAGRANGGPIAAILRVPQQPHSPAPARPPGSAVAAAVVDHQQLGLRETPRELIENLADRLFLVEAGNNDAQISGGNRRSASG